MKIVTTKNELRQAIDSHEPFLIKGPLAKKFDSQQVIDTINTPIGSATGPYGIAAMLALAVIMGFFLYKIVKLLIAANYKGERRPDGTVSFEPTKYSN